MVSTNLLENKLKLRYIATKNLWLEGEVWHTAESIVFALVWTKQMSVSCWVSEDSDDWMLAVIWLSSDSPNSTSVFYSQDYNIEHFYSVITVQDNKKSWIDCTNSFVVNLWCSLDLDGFLLNYILNLFSKTVLSPGISIIAKYQSKYYLIFVTNLLHSGLISVT